MTSYSNGFHSSNITTQMMTSPAPLSDEGYMAIGVYLICLWVIAFVGNTTVLLVLAFQKGALRKLQNILMINMALADLLVTMSAYPLTAVSSFHKRWLFGDFTCQLGGFLVFMLTMVSMDTLTFIAVFRYILVCKPKYHHLLQPEMARPVVAITWLHSLLWTALPLLGWNSYVPEPFLTSCSLDWANPSDGQRLYVILTILTCYVLHVTVVIVCYGSILSTSRRLTFGTSQGSSLIKLEEVLWHHKVQTERGVTKLCTLRVTKACTMQMCAVMIVAFLVCWTPYAVISLLPMFGVLLSVPVTTLPTMFAKLSCALNPLVYAVLSSKFRRALASIGPWAQRNQNRVATAAIEMPGEPKENERESVEVREYRGDMTNQGVYIGNLAVALEVQSTVF